MQELCAKVILPDDSWVSQSTAEISTIFKISHKRYLTEGETIPVVTQSLTVKSDKSWMVFVHGKHVAANRCNALKDFPIQINSADTLQRLTQALDSLHVCAGHPEEEYVSLVEAWKGIVQRGTSTEKSAAINEYFPVELNGHVYNRTVCSVDCEMIVHEMKCDACKAYRSNLWSLCSRHKQQINVTPTKRTNAVSQVNFCYLSTPEKAARLSSCSTEAKVAKKEVKCLKHRLEDLAGKEGIYIDDDLQSNLTQMIGEQTDQVRKAFLQEHLHGSSLSSRLKLSNE